MWTTEVTYNLSDANAAHLVFAADTADVRLKIAYLTHKVGGSATAPFDDIPSVQVLAGSTALFTVDLSNPAFADGYGALVARSVTDSGDPSPVPFLAYSVVNAPADANPITGAGYVGTEFRLPLVASPFGQRARLVITALGGGVSRGGTLPVRIRQPVAGGLDTTIDVPPGATLSWDSAAAGVSLTDGSQLVVSCIAPLVVSAFVRRPNSSFHVSLPACAPVS